MKFNFYHGRINCQVQHLSSNCLSGDVLTKKAALKIKPRLCCVETNQATDKYFSRRSASTESCCKKAGKSISQFNEASASPGSRYPKVSIAIISSGYFLLINYNASNPLPPFNIPPINKNPLIKSYIKKDNIIHFE